MLQKLIILIGCVSVSFTVISQNHIFYLNQRFGVATNHTKLPSYPLNSFVSFDFDEALSNKNFRLRYDFGTILGYEYKLFKSTKTFVYTAFELSQSRHDFRLSEFSHEHFDVVTRRNAFHLGFRQRFSFWEDQLQLGFGLGLVKRFYIENEKIYEKNTEYISESRIINTEYTLTTFHDGFHYKSGFIPNRKILNSEIEVFSTFKINDYLSLKLNFMYNRNNKIFYLLAFKSRTYDLDQGIIIFSEFDGHTSQNDSKLFTNNHHIYAGIGLEINFNELFCKSKINE